MPGVILAAAVLIGVWSACDEQAPPSGTGGGGGGVGGCEPGPPAALYTLSIATEIGPLPADTTVSVRWSAGNEPAFVLGDEGTHLTLEDGSNLVCEASAEDPPLTITCELWTSGATEVAITATGYDDWLETLIPGQLEGCDEPVPTETEVVLVETMEEPPR